MNDPFSLVFDRLWLLIDESPLMTSLVKPGNKIKYNETNRDPEKRLNQDADTPELRLEYTGVQELNLHHSSCSALITQGYSWILSTGDKRINEKLNPVRFALICAMMNYKTRLTDLQWMGKTFVKKVELQTSVDTLVDEQNNRNLDGWCTLWTGNVSMVFKQSDLILYQLQAGSSSSGV